MEMVESLKATANHSLVRQLCDSSAKEGGGDNATAAKATVLAHVSESDLMTIVLGGTI